MKSLQLDKPHILVAIGIPGSGKSFFAKQFSDTFNSPFIDYDYYKQLISNEALAEQIISETMSLLVLTKQTIILDGIGNRRAERQELALFAHKNGYEVLYIWVQTEPATARQRAVTSKTATMSGSEFEERVRQFEILTKNETYLVISGKHTYPSQAKVVLKKIVTANGRSDMAVTQPRQTPPSTRGRIIVG